MWVVGVVRASPVPRAGLRVAQGADAAGCVAQVGRSSLLVGALHKQYAQELLPDKLPPQDNTTTTDSDMEEPYLQGSARAPGPPSPWEPPGISPGAPRLSWLVSLSGCPSTPPRIQRGGEPSQVEV